MLAAATPAPQPRIVHVEHCMGTVFSFDIRGGVDAGADVDEAQVADAVRAAVGWLHRVDRVFSTYRPDSDISRMRGGELRAADADPEVAVVLELCAQVQTATNGYFSAMPDRQLDPTGLVKGWAIERASRILREHGCPNHAVNGGGDIQFAGEAAPGRAWTVAIVDPADGTGVRAVARGRNVAVATSGTTERGQHIVDPFTGRAATSTATAIASATVAGPSLTFADAYATAAFVMGRDALRWIADIDEYEVLLIGVDGALLPSAGWSERFG